MASSAPSLQPETPATRCPACGGGTFNLFCDASELAAQQHRAERFHAIRLAGHRKADLAERASFTHDYATNLLFCDGCGLILRSPRPPAAAIEETYTEERYPAERLDEMTRSQLEAFRPKLPVLRALGVAGEVLEVGSFLGGFLEAAREAGWDATGVDPGKQLGERCRRRGLRVIEATLEDFAEQAGGARYGCVAIWNTFDQLPHPSRALEAAAGLLRPGGVLALRVPHGSHYRRLLPRLAHHTPAVRYATEVRFAWNNLLAFPYLYGYGIESLDGVVGRFGFERVHAAGDVLCRLSGRATAAWGRQEEKVLKCWQLGAIASESRAGGGRFDAAPWLDVYYRRPGRA